MINIIKTGRHRRRPTIMPTTIPIQVAATAGETIITIITMTTTAILATVAVEEDRPILLMDTRAVRGKHPYRQLP